MFWGLIMEPGMLYTQNVTMPFHISMASIDIENASNQWSQVMCVFEGRNYLLCTLNKTNHVQCALDLNFEAGSKISFATNGNSHIHLTGYLTGDDADDVATDFIPTPKRVSASEGKSEPPKKKKKSTFELLTGSILEEESSDSDFIVDEAFEDDEEVEDEGVNGEEDEGEEEESSEDEENNISMNSIASDEELEEEEVPAASKLNGVAKKKNKHEKSLEKQQKQQQKAAKLKGGVIIDDLKEGAGEPVKSGKFVHVYYEGRLKSTNKKFDSTNKGAGFGFRVGIGEVIQGWDVGIIGMKVGGKRRITCPPAMAYGAKGSPPVIPPNSTLVFDVELRKVK